MEILVPNWAFDGEFKDKRDAALTDLNSDLSKLSNDYKLKDTDIGLGADYPSVLIQVLSFAHTHGFNVDLLSLFLAGKPLQENLAAWSDMSKKFIDFFANLQKKHKDSRIDEQGALLLAFNEIANEEDDIISIELIQKQIYNGSTVHGNKNNKKQLDYTPDRFYLYSFKVNNEKIYIIGLKSNGDIDIKYNLNITEWWNFRR